jgi:endogenous inhibitor of DNA gyrase (YacG/DUF329 family)
MACPNCGAPVFADETIDDEWWGNQFDARVRGTCSHCKKSWEWTEVFNYSHDEDIKEITED